MTAKRSNNGNPHLCQFAFADGRRCRMLRHKDHLSLCLFHARQEQQFQEAQQLGAQLATSLTGDFLTATDINHVLGKLFTALAQKRISLRDASRLAHIGQLLLHSLRYVKEEFKFYYTYEKWQAMIDDAVALPDLPQNDPNDVPEDETSEEEPPADSESSSSGET